MEGSTDQNDEIRDLFIEAGQQIVSSHGEHNANECLNILFKIIESH